MDNPYGVRTRTILGKRVSAEQRLQIADALFELNHIEEALLHYSRAEQLHGCTDGLGARRWLCLMLLGRFEQAWRETDRTEARRLARGDTTRHLQRHFQRVWDGTPLQGRRVLVRCYHGLGDTVQFIRYMPLLRERASTVVLQCQPKLAPLLGAVAGIDEMIFLDDGRPEPPFDVDIELMELAYAFRTTLETIPKGVPYLTVPRELIECYKPARHAGELNIGLVWSSGDWNPERSVRLAEFAWLSRLRGVRLYSLQRGPAEAEIESCGFDIVPLNPAAGVMEDATLIMNLDVIISVDTMVAHLAGALARPVWTLLPFSPDWRWMIHRADSPWYPTMRLFRQSRRGEWRPVIEEVAKTLSAIMAR